VQEELLPKALGELDVLLVILRLFVSYASSFHKHTRTLNNVS
jgi:hypothetical protein